MLWVEHVCIHPTGGLRGRSPPVFTSWLDVRWHECVLRVYNILHCPFRRRNVNEVCFCGPLVSDSLSLSFRIQMRCCANDLRKTDKANVFLSNR